MRTRFPAAPCAELERFLSARKGNRSKAERMYREHLAWRREQLPVELDDRLRCELATRKFFLIDGRARDGSAVAVFYGPRHDPKRFSTAETVRMVIYLIELALGDASGRAPADKLTLVLYAPAGTPFDLGLIRSICTVFSNNYPERLARAIAFPTGPITPMIWGAAKLFIDPVTANKVQLFEGRANPRLGDFVPFHLLPLEFVPEAMRGDREPVFLPCLEEARGADAASHPADACHEEEPPSRTRRVVEADPAVLGAVSPAQVPEAPKSSDGDGSSTEPVPSNPVPSSPLAPMSAALSPQHTSIAWALLGILLSAFVAYWAY